MLSLLWRTLISTSLILAISFSTLAGGKPSSLEACAKLLPDGHKYEVSIKLIVDKELQKPDFSGKFSVEGGADGPSDFDIAAFVECVGPLIKGKTNT